MTTTPPQSDTGPSFIRKIAVILYDSLLLIGVLFVAGLIYEGLQSGLTRGTAPWPRLAFQLYLLAIMAAYFAWFWHRGQTLAMKAWRVHLAAPSGTAPSYSRALLRFAVAGVGFALLGVTLWWSIFDRQRQYAHDRLIGTKLQQR